MCGDNLNVTRFRSMVTRVCNLIKGGKMLRFLIVLQIVCASVIVHCERRFIVAPGHSLCDSSTWNVAGSQSVEASCSGLSELLQAIRSNIAPGDNVTISIEGGNEYYLDTSIYFVVQNASFTIRGVKSSSVDSPRIICNLTDTLPATTLYTLRFDRVNSVVLDQLEVVGCSRSLSFSDMLNLTITNSLFRLVQLVMRALASLVMIA